MNVFEDLIGELKEENLLEDTVIELKKPDQESEFGATAESADSEGSPVEVEPADTSDSPVSGSIGDDRESVADIPEITKPANEREFFRKRAMEEVSSLQMVEHVLAGVEREHLKTPAASYDDLQVKKALHKFMVVSGDVNSEEHADAEFELMRETQGWHTALSARDKNVSVANIRRFCENSRPVLSSQALMALARFYRNSSFNEEVRSKFEYVMTRLFSRDAGLETRKLLFPRPEMVTHIRTLYSNWSSVLLHSAADHQADIDLALQRYADIVNHFESAATFDDLLNADVFNSIRHFKEECGELFYVPEITAAGIECNVRLGNKYVELLLNERGERGASAVEEKYGYTYDQAVSGATGKTLLLSELMKQRPEEKDAPAAKKPEFEQESFDISKSVVIRDLKPAKRAGIFGVSRWLVVTTVIAAALSGGLYFWADKFGGGSDNVLVATELDMGDSDLKAHIRTIRVSHETAYAVTQPSWDALNEFDQKEFLRKVFEFAQSKGLKKVNLLNYKGRTVAFATKDKFELFGPG
jgi:hypothetical protein